MWMAALFRGGTPRSLPILSFTRRCVHAERVPRHRVTGAPLRLHASLPQKSRFRLLIASRDLVWTLYRRNRVDFHAKFTLPLSSLCSFLFSSLSLSLIFLLAIKGIDEKLMDFFLSLFLRNLWKLLFFFFMREQKESLEFCLYKFVFLYIRRSWKRVTRLEIGEYILEVNDDRYSRFTIRSEREDNF